MPSADYTFRLNKFHCNTKQSNGNYADNDYVFFSVVVNGMTYLAPACTPPSGNGLPTAGTLDVVFDGDDVALWDKQPEDDTWQIGPITIDDQDTVIVLYTITNLSYHDPAAQAAESLKIIGATISALGGLVAVVGGIIAALSSPTGIGVLVGAVVAIIGGIIGFVGGVLQTVGEVLGKLGGDRPNCDGLILTSPPLGFTGAQLETSVATGTDAPGVFSETFLNSHLPSTSPSGCSEADTDVTWSILRNIQGALTSGTPPKQMSIKMLAASQTPQDWGSMWGDEILWENSRIQCVITSSGSGPTGATAQERANSYAAGLVHSLQTEPMTLTLLSSPAKGIRSSSLAISTLPPTSVVVGGASVVPVSARYTATITERFGSAEGAVLAQLTSANLIEIPMQTEPFTSDKYEQDTLHTGHLPLSGIGVRSLGIAEPLPPIKTGGLQPIPPPGIRLPIKITTPQKPLPIAATLAASAQISLELFGEFDQSNKIIGHRVRYIRSDANGVVRTDVMLAPTQHIAR